MRRAPAMIAAAGSILLSAQSPADDVTRIEQLRVEAIRSGQDVARFYAPGYRGINALGQYETRDQAIKTDANGARGRQVAVELHGDTAIVTGTEGPADAGDRVLRIWTRDGNTWTIAAAQTTWIGTRPGVAPPAGPLPNAVAPFVPRTAVEDALWTSQDALMRSFSEADPASYRMFSTDRSLRMTTNGDAIPRDQWLDTIAKRAKGPLAVVDEVRIASYGDVGIVTLRGHEANPTRQSWIYLQQDGAWKLHLRYTTVMRP